MAETAPQLQPVPSGPRRASREEPSPIEPLWRHMLGDRLRTLRHDRGETLGETAARAGVSPQYLSEMERGAKEPSSEMIAAVAGALDSTLLDLTLAVAEGLRNARPASVQVTAGRAMLALAA
jgi:transcriptional regulator with XRE-family HTH domain